MTDFARALGDRIRQVRGGMSQTEFATKLGVHKNLIGKYERGESVPGGEILGQIRDTLGVSIDWLLTGWTPPVDGDDDDHALADIATGLERQIAQLEDDFARLQRQHGPAEAEDVALARGITQRLQQLRGNLMHVRGEVPVSEVLGQVALDPACGSGHFLTKALDAARVELDEDLHGRVVEGISTVYTEMGARIALRDLGRLAARIHADLIAAYEDPSERPSGLKMALQQLRRDIAAPPSAQNQTKSSA